MDEKLELQPGSGFFLCIEQKGTREVILEVSEKCFRRHRPLGTGSPYTPPAYYEHRFGLFE